MNNGYKFSMNISIRHIKTCFASFGVVLFLFVSDTYGTDPTTSKVAESFYSYQQALSERNGGLASSLIAYKTHAFFEKARRLALEADRDTLLNLEFPFRMYALLLRGTQEYEFLKSTQGKTLLGHLISQGAIATGGLDIADIVSIDQKSQLAFL